MQPDDALIDPQGARIIVFGMGRVGAGAYDELVEPRRRIPMTSSSWRRRASTSPGICTARPVRGLADDACDLLDLEGPDSSVDL